MLREV